MTAERLYLLLLSRAIQRFQGLVAYAIIILPTVHRLINICWFECRSTSEIALAVGAAEDKNETTGFKRADGTLMSPLLDQQHSSSSGLQYVDVESCGAVCECDKPHCRAGPHTVHASNNAWIEAAQEASVCQCQACTLELGNPKQDPEFLSLERALRADAKSKDENSRAPAGKESDHQLRSIFAPYEQDYVAREALRLWLKLRIYRLRQQLSSSRRDGKSFVAHAFAVPWE